MASWLVPESRGLEPPTPSMSTDFAAGRTAGYVIGFTEAASSNRKLWAGFVGGAAVASLIGILWHAFSSTGAR